MIFNSLRKSSNYNYFLYILNLEIGRYISFLLDASFSLSTIIWSSSLISLPSLSSSSSFNISRTCNSHIDKKHKLLPRLIFHIQKDLKKMFKNLFANLFFNKWFLKRNHFCLYIFKSIPVYTFDSIQFNIYI